MRCVTGDPTSPATLNAFFSSDDAAGLSGGDYPHAYELSPGHTLWLFQDVFLGKDSKLWDDGFAHNTGLLQVGSCFKPITDRDHGDWLKIPTSRQLTTWLWPLDGEVGSDGMFHLFLVEMHNSAGTGAEPPAAPRATWLATIDPVTLEVASIVPAPNPGGQLYGWSIVTAGGWSYLYGHCYQQFTTDVLFFGASAPVKAHAACAKDMTVARVPAGEFGAVPTYWDGSGFVADATAAVPVQVQGAGDVFLANPLQVAVVDGRFVAVSKIDDWWGNEIRVYTAGSPTGPFSVAASLPDSKVCGSCNTYGAFILPSADPATGGLVVAISNNAFAMRPDSFNNAALYRSSFFSVEI